MEATPVMRAPAAGTAITTQGGVGVPTVTMATPVTPVAVASTVPFAPTGGWAVIVTVGPADVFSVPTPFVTTHVNAAPGTGLSQASNAVAVKDWFVKGRRVAAVGTTSTRTMGPGDMTTEPLNPSWAPKEAWMRIVSVRVYVCVASVAVPPTMIARLDAPRMPL